MMSQKKKRSKQEINNPFELKIMKAFFRDIFEYHHHFNQHLAQQMIQHYEAISDKAVSLFSHAINAHQIWNARITGNNMLGVHDIHTLEKCKKLDKSNLLETFGILEEYDLEKKIDYTNSKSLRFSNSIQEILFHICNHFAHHKGQIITDIRQSGITPIATDYIFFKRQSFIDP